MESRSREPGRVRIGDDRLTTGGYRLCGARLWGGAVADSPSGLLAWIVEKYRAWSDNDGDLSTRFSDDFVLTQASLYWFTGTISTSFRPYYEMRAA